MASTRADQVLASDEAAAWQEYLDTTRGQSELRYEEVEPWAWVRLQNRLRAIGARRAALREPSTFRDDA